MQKAALANYKLTIITGFSEFENALVSLIKTKEQAEKQVKRVGANRKYFNLSRIRYEEGYVDYITELDAIRQLFDAQVEETSVRAATYSSAINLYLAMGGGWIVAEKNQPICLSRNKRRIFRSNAHEISSPMDNLFP